jgi:hypothetical protein
MGSGTIPNEPCDLSLRRYPDKAFVWAYVDDTEFPGYLEITLRDAMIEVVPEPARQFLTILGPHEYLLHFETRESYERVSDFLTVTLNPKIYMVSRGTNPYDMEITIRPYISRHVALVRAGLLNGIVAMEYGQMDEVPLPQHIDDPFC